MLSQPEAAQLTSALARLEGESDTPCDGRLQVCYCMLRCPLLCSCAFVEVRSYDARLHLFGD
jgi:hypothetical protein